MPRKQFVPKLYQLPPEEAARIRLIRQRVKEIKRAVEEENDHEKAHSLRLRLYEDTLQAIELFSEVGRFLAHEARKVQKVKINW